MALVLEPYSYVRVCWVPAIKLSPPLGDKSTTGSEGATIEATLSLVSVLLLSAVSLTLNLRLSVNILGAVQLYVFAPLLEFS